MHVRIFLFCIFVGVALAGWCQPSAPLAGTGALTNRDDLSVEMVAGIDRWLMRETDRVSSNRAGLWMRQVSAPGARAAFLDAQRKHLREIIGAVDERIEKPHLEFFGNEASGAEVYRSRGPGAFVVYRVRWPVFEGVFGEGLLLQPVGSNGIAVKPVATAIAIPDADQAPEAVAGLIPGVPPESAFARHLAESRWRVLVPALIGRADTFSGNKRLNRFTNQPHREWLYRQAYEVGRHVIGFEVQKVLAGLEAVEAEGGRVAIAGYGEGGLIGLYASALEPRVAATLVSGYFAAHDQLWSEPIYRNIFQYLNAFDAAELSVLANKVVVEYTAGPRVAGPPAPRSGRSGAAPGVLATPEFGAVESEVERANELLAKAGKPAIEFVHGSEGTTVQPGSRRSLAALADALKVSSAISFDTAPLASIPTNSEAADREQRAVRELEAFTQGVLRRSEIARDEKFWRTAGGYIGDTNAFAADLPKRRAFFWSDVIGKIEAAKLPPNARTRQLYDKPKWSGYEVMLDVVPDVFAWGYLLVPKDLKPGERRPVVVCQHGLEGLPEHTVTDDPKSPGFGSYQAFAARLAERGFIVYAPHNPYRGRDAFRVLQRKSNPLGLSLFSFIIAQHEVTTDWLASLPFVDPKRIAFYGLSYGGKTAMRVPAVVERYCLSICSGDFNEWVQKNATTESSYSYMFTMEYEMPEWNLGHTFNYSEMAALIFPRPFMVERGHSDGVAPDSWVAFEYAKVRRLYDRFNLGDRTEIEFFNGPHTIYGVGTFQFLHKQLSWPEK